MKDLGITHLHLLPVYDYASVDETKSDKPQFNWGYDPENIMSRKAPIPPILTTVLSVLPR